MGARERDQRRTWEDAYAEDAAWFGTEPSQAAAWARDALPSSGTARVLELGAGHGRDTLALARTGADVTAVDYARSGADALAAAARDAGLDDRIETVVHDVREPLPFDDAAFDLCYSHMLLCMDLTLAEIRGVLAEARRVLRPGGACIYTARNGDDPHHGEGVRRGEDRWEVDGFVVHFLTDATVRELAEGWEIVETRRFEEGELPRRLTWVHMAPA